MFKFIQFSIVHNTLKILFVLTVRQIWFTISYSSTSASLQIRAMNNHNLDVLHTLVNDIFFNLPVSRTVQYHFNGLHMGQLFMKSQLSFYYSDNQMLNFESLSVSFFSFIYCLLTQQLTYDEELLNTFNLYYLLWEILLVYMQMLSIFCELIPGDVACNVQFMRTYDEYLRAMSSAMYPNLVFMGPSV